MNIFEELEKKAKENRSGDPMKDVVNLFLVISLCREELLLEKFCMYDGRIGHDCDTDDDECYFGVPIKKINEVLGEKQ